MSFFSYIFPATLLHFALVVGYNLLWLAGYADPIERWWVSLGQRQPAVYVLGYLALVLLIATLGVVRRWHIGLRWVLELGSRRGLRIGGVPLLDLALLVLCAAVALLVANLAPQSAEVLWYLLGPLAFALVINLIFGLPPELATVASSAQTLAELARSSGCDPAATARENGLDPLDTGAPVGFAQEIRLPLPSLLPPSTPRKPASGSGGALNP